MKKSIFAKVLVHSALVCAVLFLPLQAFAGEGIVAKVNGKSITEQDMALAEAEIGADLGNLPASTKRRVLVEYLIENHLYAGAAKDQQLGSGKNFDNRMAYWKRRALRDEYFEKNIRNSVSEAAAKTFYNDQVKALQGQEEVKARHILVGSKEDAAKIATQLKHGGDFVKLAKENSKDPGTKDNGGLLGFFGKGQMVPQFEQAAFALKVGEVSEPVQSQFGWHLIKLEERRAKPPPTFDEVKDRILNSMIHRKSQEVAASLRNKAEIEYLDADIKKQVDAQANQEAARNKMMQEQIKKRVEQMEKNKK